MITQDGDLMTDSDAAALLPLLSEPWRGVCSKMLSMPPAERPAWFKEWCVMWPDGQQIFQEVASQIGKPCPIPIGRDQ
jgi:hypothetical protein